METGKILVMMTPEKKLWKLLFPFCSYIQLNCPWMLPLEMSPRMSNAWKKILWHKEVEESNPENYRPISSLSSIKILRKIDSESYGEILSQKRPRQSQADRLHVQTVMFCYDCKNHTEFMRRGVDQRNMRRTRFIDLSKAFETFDHNACANRNWKLFNEC